MRPIRPFARMRRVTRSTSATSTASISAGDFRERPSADCDPNDPRRRRARTGRGSRLCARACRWRPEARPNSETRAASGSVRHLADRGQPPVVELRRGDRPDSPQPPHRKGMQKVALPAGGHDQQAVGLGHAAGHLGQVLGVRPADGERQAHLRRARPVAGAPRCPRVCRRCARAPGRRGTPRRSTAAPPPERPRGRSRTPPCWPRCRPPSAAARRAAPGRGDAPASRPSPSGHRRRGPRSSRPARRRCRPPWAGPAAAGRRAARPRRRRRRGRREGPLARTYVRISGGRTVA